MTARIVPPEEAAAVRDTPLVRETFLPALLAGEVVHVDDLRNHVSAHRLRSLGLRLRTRLDGNGGRYLWTEPL